MYINLINKWKEKEHNIADLKKRKYFHFDRRIDFRKNSKKLTKEICNSKSIEQHSFYPFISTKIETKRYKKIKNDSIENGRSMDVKERPIAYASHFDALVYSWYSVILTDTYQSQLNFYGIKDCVLAYLETGKCNIDYSFEVFSEIKKRENSVAIAVDITSFFDNLDHQILKQMWLKVIGLTRLPQDQYNVFKSLTNYSYVSKEIVEDTFPIRLIRNRYCTPLQFRKYIRGGKLISQNKNYNKIEDSIRKGNKCGIPQGSPISAVLSNIYMINFDIVMNEFAKTNNGIYRRYCDDIILICEKCETDNFLSKLQEQIKNYELSINPSKTEFTYFSNHNGSLRGYKTIELNDYSNLQYLGFEFNGENIYIRSSSISKYKRRIANQVHKALKMKNGKKALSNIVFKKKILNRFSSKGQRNFISYAIRASKEIMHSTSIKKQYNRSIDNIIRTIKNKEQKQINIITNQR